MLQLYIFKMPVTFSSVCACYTQKLILQKGLRFYSLTTSLRGTEINFCRMTVIKEARGFLRGSKVPQYSGNCLGKTALCPSENRVSKCAMSPFKRINNSCSICRFIYHLVRLRKGVSHKNYS